MPRPAERDRAAAGTHRIVRRAEQPRQLIKAPLGTLTPGAGGHLSPVCKDLDQSRPGRRTVARSEYHRASGGRVARAAAQLSEDRGQHGRPLGAGCGGSGRSPSLRAVDLAKAPSGRRRSNALRSSTAWEATLPSIGFGNDSIRTVPPCLLQDQRAGPARNPAPAPGRHHGVADLDLPLRTRWPMESDVTHNHTIDDDLMDPPGRRTAWFPPIIALWAAHTIADRIDAVEHRILRMPEKSGSADVWPPLHWRRASGLPASICRATPTGSGTNSRS